MDKTLELRNRLFQGASIAQLEAYHAHVGNIGNAFALEYALSVKHVPQYIVDWIVEKMAPDTGGRPDVEPDTGGRPDVEPDTGGRPDVDAMIRSRLLYAFAYLYGDQPITDHHVHVAIRANALDMVKYFVETRRYTLMNHQVPVDVLCDLAKKKYCLSMFLYLEQWGLFRELVPFCVLRTALDVQDNELVTWLCKPGRTDIPKKHARVCDTIWETDQLIRKLAHT